MRESLYDYCMRTGTHELLAQWNGPRNGVLTSRDISFGSSKKIWWICAEGHEWQAAAWSRTSQGSGCPVCAGKVLVPGVNDLMTRDPDLAKQWHPTKNGSLSPQDVMCGSRRRVWWMCSQGHEWEVAVKVRSSGNGCPFCAGKILMPGINDLQTVNPDLAAQWHPTKNGDVTPDAIISGSRQKAWWICSEGHEWQARINSRSSNGSGCPICSGRQVIPGENDLATLYPLIAQQWHPTKNGSLTAANVSAYSNRKVWWMCQQGHEWCSDIKERTARNKGCPYCTGRRVLAGYNDLETVYPKIAEQWYQPFNGALTPRDVTAGSSQKVWWQCSEGHIWKSVIHSRTGARKHGCPECAAGNRKKRGINRNSSDVFPIFTEGASATTPDMTSCINE